MNDAAGSRTPEEAAGSRTPEEEALAGEIERTREQLGETVEALAAKADVKGRAQHRVAEVTGNLRGKARAAKDKVTVRTNRGKVASASLAALVVLAWLALRRRR
jgi:Protein of unknown function (DUF3618)